MRRSRLLLLVALLALVGGGLVLVHQRALDRARRALAEDPLPRTRVTAESLSLAPPTVLRLTGVTVESRWPRGELVARLPRVELELAAVPLLLGRLAVTRVRLSEAEIELTPPSRAGGRGGAGPSRDSASRRRPDVAREDGPVGEPPPRLTLDAVEISRATVRVTAGERRLDAEGVEASLVDVVIGEGASLLTSATARGRLTVDEIRGVFRASRLEAGVELASGRLVLAPFSIRPEHGSLQLERLVIDLGGRPLGRLLGAAAAPRGRPDRPTG